MSHTYENIISLENLLLAWQEFVVGKKKKYDVQLFARNLMDNILSLHEDLVKRSYQHGHYESFYVNDPKRRHIHKASVRDRLLHHAVYRILYPFFDHTFIADSFSCRMDKGVHKAINRFQSLARQVSKNHTRTVWILKCDIKKFFASIDHGILLNILAEYIPNKEVMRLLGHIVGSFRTEIAGSIVPPEADCGAQLPLSGSVLRLHSARPLERPRTMEPAREPTRRIGLPLGNLTSQLLANVYMNRFDQWVKHELKIKYYTRYADDFVLLSPDKSGLESVIPKIQTFLRDSLRLTLHPDKIFLRTMASGVDFLGWVHFPSHRVLRKTTQRRMLARVKQNPTEETAHSYLGMLRHGNTRKVKAELLGRYWLWQ